MTDPTQFIVDQAHLHSILSHQGVLGKGRDFITLKSCSLHLYTDRFKRSYVMQQFDGVDQNFVSQKLTRITKTAHSHFMPNTTKFCCVSTKKNSKGLFDLSIFYDATGVYGYSLEYIIKMKIKSNEKFDQSEILGFFWQIADFLILAGRFTGQFLQITPVNIFCKPDQYYGYNFFPNNFGLNFDGTKWQRKYHNPDDQFWKGQKTIQSAIRTTMFTLGMVLLQLATLLPTSDLYQQNGSIDDKTLKKRIDGVKITINPQLANLIQSLLIMDESKRVRIQQIYKNQQLLKGRRVQYFQNKAGILNFKTFQGIIDIDKKTGTGEGLDQKMCIHRGKFENNKLHGIGLRQNQQQNQIDSGIFMSGKLIQGTSIKKNQSIYILNKTVEDQNRMKGIMVILNISTIQRDKNDKNVIIASEGQYIDGKLVKGKNYYMDGKEQIV